ncbi:hypothetical protein ACFL50_06945 [Candidatus Latescibacterota bacterium]
MYGGSVISCSTEQRAYVFVEDNDILEFEVEGKNRRVSSKEDLIQDNGVFDAILSVIEYFDLDDAKIKITIRSDIPVSSGLSGSTAIITALVAALLEWMNKNGYKPDEKTAWSKTLPLNKYLLAETVRHIELYFLKIVCGYQDAYMCSFGSLNFLDFRDKENYMSLKREPLGTVEDLSATSPNIPIILAHTGIKRVSGSVHKPIRDRWIEGDRHVIDGVLRISHIARMAKKAVLSGDWELLGEAMTENHEIVRSFGSSSEVNEKIIRTALDSGAIAAKLAGAGKGGTIIALNPEPDEMIEALRNAGAGRILFPRPVDGILKESETK